MYLKSIELHGFKSFPNRTVLSFEPGTTVIVGPNGSGKSNISDAMRWVLGELSSRNIRGEKMADVIFGGTDERRPMGFAEVSVTFDNTDPDNRLDSPYDEVTVTRRYYRTGESEYMINREACRLKDIHMLFMNTGVGREGYSIIGQGKVAEIISKKSDERRTIFEEAAGISKYRFNKETAEKKLKNVSENLERINDIKTEIEGQVASLEKDAEKARRGLEVFEKKKRADVSLWLFDTSKIRDDIEEAEKAWLLSKHELEILDSVISDLEQQDENLYNKSQTGKLKSSDLLEEIRLTTEELHNLDTALLTADSDFAHSLELIEACELRIREIERSESSVNDTKDGYLADAKIVEDKLVELQDNRLAILQKQDDLTRRINELKNRLDDLLLELEAEENLSTDLRVRIDVLKSAMSSDGEKSVEIAREIEKYEENGKELKREAEECEENASEFKAKIAEKDEILKNAEEKLESLNEERREIVEGYNECKLERDAADRRADDLQRMVDHFDGYLESVKFVMREYSQNNIYGAGKIYGPLSTLINVDKKYITAIEATLGASLQNIVVDNDATAKAAIKALKNANAGRATFYPVSAMRTVSETDEIKTAKSCEGFIGRADTLVKCDPMYRQIVEFLLLRTLIFDNIDNASVAASKVKYRVKIVTLDGQIINAGGAFTGGSTRRDSGTLSRTTEIASLRDKAKELSKKASEYEDAIREIDEEIAKYDEAYNTAYDDKEVLLALSRSTFAALDNANAKYEANCRIIERFKEDFDNLSNHKVEAEEEIKNLEADFVASNERMQSIKEKRAQLSLDMGALDDERDEVISEANNEYVKIAEERRGLESVNALIASVDMRLDELSAEKQGQLDRIEMLKGKSAGIDEKKAEHIAKREALENRLVELNNERRAVEHDNDEFERELLSIRQRSKEKMSSRQAIYENAMRNENRVGSLREKQDRLGSQLWDDYEITYEDAIALNYPPVTAENRDEVAEEQEILRRKLRNIGNFDPESIEKYAETKTRYDLLNTQYLDLVKSQEETLGIITRIEEEMRTTFIKAFNDINRQFGITFKELFDGGKAELTLDNPEDVLSSGIEIHAAPPGKNIAKMSLLSGGEQALVAISLLFAILQVNPTPFCILDEIEAALDEVNVGRFGDYVRRLGEDTQFILITHRRGTMEAGDRLYGITMPQRGISQAIQLDVNEIEGKQKELLDGVL